WYRSLSRGVGLAPFPLSLISVYSLPADAAKYGARSGDLDWRPALTGRTPDTLLPGLGQGIAGAPVNPALASVVRHLITGARRATITAHQHHITDVDRRFLLDPSGLGANVGGAALVLD